MREFTENVYRSNFCFDGDVRDARGGGENGAVREANAREDEEDGNDVRWQSR